jgi:hypothetical protein
LQVRLLPPQLGDGKASQPAMAAVLKTAERRALRVRLPPFPHVLLAERHRHWSSKPVRWVRFPQGTLGDRLTGRLPGFEPGDEGSIPSPRTLGPRAVSKTQRLRGRLTGRIAGPDPADAGSTPAPGTDYEISRTFVMTKRGAILRRMQRHQEALQKAEEYLATGRHCHWQEFRAMFNVRPVRLPHRDWIANVFMRRQQDALQQCEVALEILNSKAKERRVSQQRRGAAVR